MAGNFPIDRFSILMWSITAIEKRNNNFRISFISRNVAILDELEAVCCYGNYGIYN